jgi:hypothetical protein
MAIDPGDPGTVYAAVGGEGVYKLTGSYPIYIPVVCKSY